MKRPLRSVMLCQPRYLSAYVLGVAQAMGLRGDWHRQVSIFDDAASIAQQIAEMAPDVIWTHCVVSPPEGACKAEELASILSTWKRRGAVVFLHDGDPRARAIGVDVPACFSMALVNRNHEARDNRYWGVPWLRWPYAAMVQREMVPPRPECDLLFAGLLRRDPEGAPGLYGTRTAVVWELHHRLWPRMQLVSPGAGDINNRMQVADVAARAGAVLGFGRPEVPGWVDTRCFQWSGAGGVLIHDDAAEFLTPGEHYLPFERVTYTDTPESGPPVTRISMEPTVDNILRCVERAKVEGPAIRERAFAHVQRHHTWVNRVEQALAPWFGKAS